MHDSVWLNLVKRLKREKRQPFFLLAVFLLAFFVRVYNLEKLPNGVNWDETAYAYNAYSLLETGKDEWGNAWPLFLKSFGEYKPALLSYVMMPWMLVFPDSVLSARLTSVLLGSLSVVAFYGLVCRLARSAKIAAVAAVVVALTPWHIHFSRVAIDPIVGVSLLVSGMWAWVHPRREVKLLGGVLLGLSMYGYNAQRLFVPLFFLVLGMFWLVKTSVFSRTSWQTRRAYIQKMVQKMIQIYFWPVAVMCVIGGSVLALTLFSEVGSRARSASFFDEQPLAVSLSQVVDEYKTYVSPKFLFLPEGGVNASPILGFPQRGNLLEITFPFLLLGVLVSLFQRKPYQWFFLIWLIVAVLPGAVTSDSPHAGRSLGMVPPLAVFTAVGVMSLSSVRRKKMNMRMQGVLLCLWLALLGANFVSFWNEYTKEYPGISETSWQGQFRTVTRRVQAISQDYPFTHIVFSQASDYHALLFYSWYAKVDPRTIHDADRGGHSPFYLRGFAGASLYEGNMSHLACLLQQPQTLLVLAPSDAGNLVSQPLDVVYYDPTSVYATIPAFYIYHTDYLTADDEAWAKRLCLTLTQ